MEKRDFADFIQRLYAYLGKSRPLKDQMAEWFSEVHRLPAEFLEWVLPEMKRELDNLPINLPKYLRAMYGKWLNDHPEKQEFFRQCSESWCDGQGIIHAVKVMEDRTVQVTAFRCASCQQSRMPAFEATSRVLKESGWKLDCTEETNKRIQGRPRLEMRRTAPVGEITKSWGEREWLEHSR